MADWSDRLEQLLFEGEHVETTVEVGTGTVAVTGQRVLVFTPGGDGKQFRDIDRPNVLGVERRAISPFDLVPRAAKLGVAGVLLVLVGVVLDPAALFPRPDLSGAQAAGGLLGPVNTMLDLFYAVDTVAIALGALLAIVSAGLVGVQLATRRDNLAIEVAGEDDVLLSKGDDESTITDLQSAIDVPTPEEPATT